MDASGKYVTTNNEGPIYDAIKLAFGEEPDLRLKSDDWTASSIPSFWSNATATWSNVQKLSDMMYGFTSTPLIGNAIASAMNIGQYGSSEEIVYEVAGAVDGSFEDKQAFVDQWATYGQYEETDEKSGGDNFGIDESTYSGREFYSAMRAAYNNCVSTYVKQHHSTASPYSAETVDKHVAGLAGYGESAGELVQEKVNSSLVGDIVNAVADENLPRQLCKASFSTEEGKSYFGDSGAGDCAECKRLYNEYVSSGADKTDAAAVYDTFKTASEADPRLFDGSLVDADGNEVDFFTYYGKQLAEYEGMYNAVTQMANGQSTIVIQIYLENGTLKCDVSPVEANPRND